jgi:hypothetical protein
MHESPNGAFSLVPLVRPDDAYSTVLYNVQAACATARALESRCVGMFRGLILYCTIPPPAHLYLLHFLQPHRRDRDKGFLANQLSRNLLELPFLSLYCPAEFRIDNAIEAIRNGYPTTP